MYNYLTWCIYKKSSLKWLSSSKVAEALNHTKTACERRHQKLFPEARVLPKAKQWTEPDHGRIVTIPLKFRSNLLLKWTYILKSGFMRTSVVFARYRCLSRSTFSEIFKPLPGLWKFIMNGSSLATTETPQVKPRLDFTFSGRPCQISVYLYANS